MDNVTKMDLKRFLEDLEILQNKPFDDPQRTFEIWKDALEDVTLLEFEKAKKRLLQEWKYSKFPKPADLISHAKEYKSRMEETPVTDFEEKPKSKYEIKRTKKAMDNFFEKNREAIEEAKRLKKLHEIALGHHE